MFKNLTNFLNKGLTSFVKFCKKNKKKKQKVGFESSSETNSLHVLKCISVVTILWVYCFCFVLPKPSRYTLTFIASMKNSSNTLTFHLGQKITNLYVTWYWRRQRKLIFLIKLLMRSWTPICVYSRAQ